MNDKDMVRLSKRLSNWLRHHPEAIGLDLDTAGWVPVDALLRQAAAHGKGFTRAQLDLVVERNNKRRFEFDDAGTAIRARQGHSIPVRLGYAAAEPPAVLYHGTTTRTLPLILAEGLRPMRRHAVHLSADTDTAQAVGTRHGTPVILTVDAAAMHRDGHEFAVTGNGVWLVSSVEPRYLQPLNSSG
ncbi:RNA 2'-phosphotransferase [Nocardia sp. NPDC050406]|uniref:RNA 2'-phosphotransferase n=1 Tax=Nocardia sp. NPDC050406 TaxID=3364318 RepID=UPI0037A07743